MNDRLSIRPPNYIERLGVYLPRQRLSANPLRTTEMLKKLEFVVLLLQVERSGGSYRYATLTPPPPRQILVGS